MNLQQYFKEKREIIDKALNNYLLREGKLAEAMRYSVFAGGKRFRPILCMATAKALGEKPEKILPIACAIEMLHTFTLIHDDLPAMDNADFRRGKPTCHKAYGEALAILTGDALNTLAFEMVAREIGIPKVISEIGRALLDVVSGQVSDLEKEKIDLETLKSIHARKTGAMLRACVRSTGLLCGASEKQLQDLTSFADHLGLAFQIADDILDATSTKKELGKPVKADIYKGFPYVVGLEQSKKMADEEKNKAIAALCEFDEKANRLREIAEYVVQRKK